MGKNPFVAAILNFFLVGLGYLYIGKRNFLSVILTIWSLLLYLAVLTNPASTSGPSSVSMGIILLVLFSFVVPIAFAYDAYKEALKMSKKKR